MGEEHKDPGGEKGNPELEAKENSEQGVPFLKLFRFADVYDYVLIIIGVVAAAAHGLMWPAFFLVLGSIVNAFGTNQNNPKDMASKVEQLSLDLVYVAIVSFVTSWGEVACWMHTGERQAAKMRYKYLEAVLRRDVAFYDMDARTGKIVESISSDTLLFQDAISEKIGVFIQSLATFVGGFVLGFYSVWRVAAVTLAMLPLMVVAGGTYAYALTGLSSKSQTAYEDAGVIAEEVVGQVRTVYSFVGESKAVNSYSKALDKGLKLGYKSGLAKGAGMGVTYLVMFCAWSLVLWYGGVLVRNGKAQGGKAVTAMFSVMMGGISLGGCISYVGTFSKGKVAAYKIIDMIDLSKTSKDSINGSTNGSKPVDVQGEIQIQNVDFSYPTRPSVMILKNFSLRIPVGETVAVVGSSGSGKSTIVSLIERFYDPIAGQVLLDGNDLKTLNIKWLRDQIGLVNQEPVLFATSIQDNIMYGNNSATPSQVIEAATAANAHGFISQLPDGYDTQTGERGVQLSGGQKQRVAIARAMLKNPKILLLDEATSALDSTSERLVQEALDLLMVGRTTIVIAHRLSTIRNVNTIAVVQKGSIVEMGSHEELIAKGETGAYASLVRLQEMAMVEDGVVTNSNEDQSRISVSNSIRSSGTMSISGPRISSGRLSGRLSGAASEVEVAKGFAQEDEMEPISEGSNFYRLWEMSLSERKYALPGYLGSILAGFLLPIFSLMISQILTCYYYTDYPLMERRITMYALIFAGVGFASLGIHILQHYFLGVMGENLTKRVRVQMFQAILRNEIGWFDREENNSSQVVSRLASDSTTVRSAIVERVSILIQNSSTLFTVFTLAFVIQWKIAFVVLATFPLLIIAAFIENVALKGFAGDIAKAHSQATQVAGEAVSNIRTVMAFNAERKVLASFQSHLKRVESRTLVRAQVAGVVFGLSQFCMYASYALALWYGSRLVRRQEAAFSDIIRIFIVVIFSAVAVAETLTLAPDIIKGGRALKSVFATLDRRSRIDPDFPAAGAAGAADAVKGDIELRRVEFRYPTRPEAVVFKGLNLAIPAGRSLALVGRSGTGKSSVIGLIMRFYDPVAGKVTIDGKDIRDFNLRYLRRHIGLVQQEPALFATTIRDNILYGGEGASQEEIVGAAEAANAHDFISALPNGYDTVVGERGAQLSGGQKQRVAIARAVLKNPRILLLDEATSALDSESEKIVQEALDRLMVGRSTVIVAHRLSTIRNASTIALLEEGKIVEQGSHSQLLANPGGAYSRFLSAHKLSSSSQTEISTRP
uniref:TSA: Wollemia nobilis Ref_Wollemi_Transcript_12661_4895 transcribed RNA sequence n=1 Tax=Wollemia nobilis TaxID=56998 RepID=A0A0C9QRK5_9CONI